MNPLLNHASDETLNDLIPASLPYPGDGEITKAIEAKTVRKPKRTKRVLCVGLAAAALAAVSIGAAAAYERWHMPVAGETYEGEYLQIHETRTYTVPPMTVSAAPVFPTESAAVTSAASAESTAASTAETAPEKRSDEWFIGEAVTVLGLVNKLDVDATRLTVTRQINQQWNREEALVTFLDEKGVVSDAKFDALDGNLIGATAFDDWYDGGTPMPEADALAAAQSYYDQLPYARGYEYDGVMKFDDHAWMYSFSKPETLELDGETVTTHSDYEQVRIIIDPCSGRFQDSNCFYVPLLDDHQPGDVPITREEALAIAEASGLAPQGIEWDSVTCERDICLPRPNSNVNCRYSSVTRWGWRIRYSGTSEFGFAEGCEICVDLFTGELLSCDCVK